MKSADSAYFRARAEQEREASRDARDKYIADIHSELAAAYDSLIERLEPGSILKRARSRT